MYTEVGKYLCRYRRRHKCIHIGDIYRRVDGYTYHAKLWIFKHFNLYNKQIGGK